MDELNKQLLDAAKFGDLNSVKSAFLAGADINSMDNLGRPSFMLSASHGHTEIVRFLLDRGADIDAKDNDGKTALIIAKEQMSYIGKPSAVFNRENNMKYIAELIEGFSEVKKEQQALSSLINTESLEHNGMDF